MHRPKRIAAVWAIAALLATGMVAPGATARADDAPPRPAGAAPLPADAVTQHVLQAGDRNLRYTARAGTLPAGENPAAPIGDIFYVAYTLDGPAAASRPIAFVFNGGPGAASAYLHLGAMGPRRVAFGARGTIPPPPGRLAANEASWLPFTDLVFIDPPGTGYSRLAERKESKEAKDDGENGQASVWSVRRDLRTLAAFVRLYLTRHNRWPSPRFIVGESYGGFRAAALPRVLEREFGVGLNGTMLVSPVIEFSLQDEDRYRIVPWALRLPSFAATAWQHGVAKPEAGGAQTIDDFRREAEGFARGDYLTALARGDTSQAFVGRLARFTGLPEDMLRRAGGRIGSGAFAKSVLRDSGRIVSLYDGSVAGEDPNPERAGVGGDSTLDPLSARITEAFTAYVANELGFRSDRAYLTLNRDISRRWNWRSGMDGEQGFVGTAESLKTSVVRNAGFGVFIAHGMFDLVTPYFASTYLVDQMALPEALRGNVTLAVYAGGHMMYTHDAARSRFARDAEAFVARTLERNAAPPAP